MLQFLKSTQRLILTSKSHWQVAISEEVLRDLYGCRQDSACASEAGGVLLGKLLDLEGAGVIETLTLPGKGDRRSRFGFFRSGRHHREARRYWQKTDQTGAYLGLWHTHPEAVPTPSSVDLEDWRQALRKDIYPGQGLLFVIVGIDAVGLWIGVKKKNIECIGHWYWELMNV